MREELGSDFLLPQETFRELVKDENFNLLWRLQCSTSPPPPLKVYNIGLKRAMSVTL